MGQTLRICYSDSPYEHLMYQVEENLTMNSELRTRNEAIVQNLQRSVTALQNQQKQLSTFAKQREDMRIFFDHYRIKLDGLEAAAKKSGN